MMWVAMVSTEKSPFFSSEPLSKLSLALTIFSLNMCLGLGSRGCEPTDICLLCSSSHHWKSHHWIWHRNRFLYRTHVPIRALSKGVSRSPCVPRSPVHRHRYLICILVGHPQSDGAKSSWLTHRQARFWHVICRRCHCMALAHRSAIDFCHYCHHLAVWSP